MPAPRLGGAAPDPGTPAFAELARMEPSPVVEANRAVAVAMVEGPDAGLAILDALASDPRLAAVAS